MLLVLGLLAALFAVIGPSPASAATGCDPAAVSRQRSTWRVTPNGADDTANLQCALTEAASASRQTRILLGEGVFKTSFLAAENLRASIVGAGTENTTIENLTGGASAKATDLGIPQL